MPAARRRMAWFCIAGAAGLSVASAPVAQVNSAARGSTTYPRVATLNRAPPQVTLTAVSGLSPFTPGCGDTDGTVYIGAEVEPHIAVNPLNPNNLIGVWQQDRYSNGASRGLVSGASFDGGATWVTRTLPVSVCTGGEYARATDPWVSFAPDGTAHQVALGVTGSEDNGISAVVVARSSDGGLTWSAPVTLIRDGTGFFNDKETITADPTDARFVYAAWDRLKTGGSGPAMFARSTNGGVTWEPARPIFDPGGSAQTIGNLVRVLPNGTLVDYATIISGASQSLNVLRSTDRGLTWSAPIFISNLGAFGARDPVTGAAIRDGSIVPQMAVGPEGTIHVVWQDARFTQLRDAIAYSRSTDGGFTWSTPARVNFNPAVWAFTPQVHVRDDGEIAVTYYDLRSDTVSTASLLADFWIARSADGVNWTETRVASPFDLDFAPNAGGLFLGDYTGLASAGSTFIAFFGETNATTPNRTDIFAARIAPAVATAGALSLKRAYRAAPMPDEEPGEEFWRAASENAHRALEARKFRALEPPARAGSGAMR